jgi:Tfp pilus assembly protein PilO
MDNPEGKPGLKAKLVAKLHEPVPLRLALGIALMASWYSLGYTQMSARIEETTVKLAGDRKRLALATEVEALRAEEAVFEDRLPPRDDPNEFLQYVLAGIRSFPLKLGSLNPEKPKDAPPFEVASVRVELEGKFEDLDAFLRWVETDKRLLRVDGVSMGPDQREAGIVRVQLSVLGLMGVEAKAEETGKSEEAAKADPAAKTGQPSNGGAAAKPKPTSKPPKTGKSTPPKPKGAAPKPAA